LSLTADQQIYPVVIARVNVAENSDWDGVVWA
jgi:hypothetical protein